MSDTTRQYVPVFLSSTYTDLIPFRKAVQAALDKLKLAVNGMEIFGARSAEPLDTCLDEVRKSHIFVGVIAMRYGSIDPKSNKSFVELEYEAAIEKQLDVHLYLIDEEKAALAPIFVDRDENATKLSDFKELLRKRHTVESFITPEDLSQKVERDLLRQFRERNLVVEGGKLLPVSEVEKALALIERFDVMPDSSAGIARQPSHRTISAGTTSEVA